MTTRFYTRFYTGFSIGRYGAFALFLLVFPLSQAEAHPHIFVEHKMEMLFDPMGLVGVRMTWSFDELYSTTLRTDYTSSKKGPLTPKDIQSLRDQHFAPVAGKRFFTGARINDERIKLSEFKDFTASFVNNKAIYSFTVPLATQNPKPSNTLELAVFDPEWFIDFELDNAVPVKVIGGEAVDAKCEATTISRDTQGYGSVDNDLVTCTYKGTTP